MTFALTGDLKAGQLAKASEINDKFNLIEASMNDLGGEPNGSHGTIAENSISEDMIQDRAITQSKVRLTNMTPNNSYDIAPVQYVDDTLKGELGSTFEDMFTAISEKTKADDSLKDILTLLPEPVGSEEKYYFDYTIFQPDSSGYLTILLKKNKKHWCTLLTETAGASPTSNFVDARYGKSTDDWSGTQDPAIYVKDHFEFGSIDSMFSIRYLIPKNVFFKVHISNRVGLKNGADNTANSGHITKVHQFGEDRIVKVLWQPLFSNAKLNAIATAT